MTTMSTINYDRTITVIPRRRWTLIAETLSNGQRTARWFRDEKTGLYYTAESWKRPNMRHRLNAEQTAHIESILP